MPGIDNHQPLIDSFLHQFMSPRVPPAAKVVSTEIAPDDLVQKVLQEVQNEPLWPGTWKDVCDHKGEHYPSQSEADFALLSIIVRRAIPLGVSANIAADLMTRIFEQSGLYRHEKRHRVLTQDIPNLIASQYLPAPQSPQGYMNSSSGSNGPRLKSGRINLSSALPPPRDFVWEGLILAGKVCVLAGYGGVSKTMLLMMLSVHIALGKDFLGKPIKVGCTLLILGEEDQDEIDRRINATCHALGLNANEKVIVGDRIRAYPMIGQDARFAQIMDGSAEGTEFPDEIIEAAKILEAEAGVPLALIGLDHAGVIHGGNFNAREDVVQTMTQVGKLATATGAATMVLAHSPKSSSSKDESDQHDVTGSTAWSDLSREVFSLKTMMQGNEFKVGKADLNKYVSFSVVKNNYGPTGEKIWLERFPVSGYGVSILGLANLTKPQAVNATQNLSTQIKTFIAQHPGQYTKTSLRKTQGGKSGPFKIGKNQVAASVEDLLASGELQLVKPTDEQRAKFGHRAQVAHILELV
ncbi:MAG: AAA family ATPase [Rhodospirillales bacterium]|jgi:hypothetical protein|nr:AAA family ATPase [Rhodospirillales bacterium]